MNCVGEWRNGGFAESFEGERKVFDEMLERNGNGMILKEGKEKLSEGVVEMVRRVGVVFSVIS